MYRRDDQGWISQADFILWDVAALQLALCCAYLTRQGDGQLPYFSDLYREIALVYGFVDLLVAIIFETMSDALDRGLYKEFAATAKHAMLVMLILVLYLFLVHNTDVYSRITVTLTALLHILFGYTMRQIWKRVVVRTRLATHKAQAILVADEHQASTIIEGASPTDRHEYRGVILINRNATGETVAGIPVVASLADAALYICREWVDEVFVYPTQINDIDLQGSSLYASIDGFFNDSFDQFSDADYEIATEDSRQEATVAALVDDCRQMSVPVHIMLPISSVGSSSFVERIGSEYAITTAARPATTIELLVKRAIDISGALVGGLAALVIMAIVAPAIKHESPGPILFKQTRIGLNGKTFKIYKIRTMYLDAEERKKELLDSNRVSDGMMFKLDWDPRVIGNKMVDGQRVTGIGDFLRSHSLDEFPQFFNVLLNQMSLVGTRPPTMDEWEQYKFHHRRRLSVKPGITGMWQVSGRSDITDFEEVVKLDTEYIDHWSIGLDFRILLRTIKVVLSGKGAL